MKPFTYFSILIAAILALSAFTAPYQNPAKTTGAPVLLPDQGCTVFYGSDGQNILAGNNEDFNNPLTLVWFIPASQGQHGRVYFGYDDYIPQGGVNDQGLFFDGLALEYKDMPIASQRPFYPGSLFIQADLALATASTVQDVIDLNSRWYPTGGQTGQQLFGDRFGNSVILDGDTVLRKQGSFQLATNFRLVDHPNPPYPDARYGVVSDMLSQADHFSVDLFRRALDAAHAEGDYPTLYSQVYELKTGIIHLYQYNDFQHEVVLNLADELAKGPHVETIASLFPENPQLETWATAREQQWNAGVENTINTQVDPAGLAWMTGKYTLQEEAQYGPVKVYLEKGQLYILRPNQLPIALYPKSADTVFHHYFNGEDLIMTFQRGKGGRAEMAQGEFTFGPLSQSYHLTRLSEFPLRTALIAAGGLVLLLALLIGLLRWNRTRFRKSVASS